MRTRKVKLNRTIALEMACRLFQANRAVASLSEFHWPRLIRYFDGDKIAELKEFIERMRTMLPSEAACTQKAQPPWYYHPDFRTPWWWHVVFAFVGPFLVYCWPLLNRMRSSWSFRCQEIAYMLNRLEAFLEMLDMPVFPSYPTIISLRHDLDLCLSIIERRCCGVRELKKIYEVEYFNMPWNRSGIPLSEIVHPKLPSAA